VRERGVHRHKLNVGMPSHYKHSRLTTGYGYALRAVIKFMKTDGDCE